MHDIKRNYEIIFEIIKPMVSDLVNEYGNLPRRGFRPKMSDLQIVSLALTAEYLSIDSENLLFKKLKSDYSHWFSGMIERSNYNRRKRNLFNFFEICRQKLSNYFNEWETCFVVDSKPLKICQYARSNRVKICQENLETSPKFGYCASQKLNYYGYKLHAVCSINGVFEMVDISSANIHDIHFLQDIENKKNDITLIGDKGYLNESKSKQIKQSNNITLIVAQRKNQKNFKPMSKIFSKPRKKIETLFSQLDGQFNLNRNYAKTFQGLKTRIVAKIAALTIIQYINKFVLFREIGKIKNPIY
jgi:Transposase DDE domain